MSECRASITIRSMLRRVDLQTPFGEEGAWALLLVPDGSTDAQVLAWCKDLLPAEAFEELKEIIEREASS